MSLQPADIEVVGGRLCLDFVNTRHSHFDPQPRDYLGDYADLLRWAQDCVGALSPAQARRLARAARAHPRRAEATMAAARALRDRLYRVFEAAARGAAPDRADLDALNRALAEALAHRRLAPDAGWQWRWEPEDALELPLWQVLASAAEVLTGDDLSRLKQCPAPDGCGWLFYDVSKNRSRRWCSMRTCGNPAKVRRFQQRHRA